MDANPVRGVSVPKLVLIANLAYALPTIALPAAATNGVERETTPNMGRNSVVESSVVKVFSTVRYPDFYKPWTKQAPQEVSGSGVVIEGKRILTTAHVVLYASQVEIQANEAGDKLGATVASVAPAIDLAVLKVDDDRFFASHAPLPRAGNLPGIKDAVMAYGYPKGGTTLSITKGIVSRIEFAGYNFSRTGLRIQIDAAINPGNSGGPAMVEDKMVGLVFSHLSGAENIGYIVPSEEIELFLQDVAAGRSDSKPALFADFRTLENPALRSFLKLDQSVEGVVISKVDDNDPAYPLKEWDVITKIGDAPVDNQGTIKMDSGLRIRFDYLVQKLAKDGRVPLTIVRGGKELAVAAPVTPLRKYAMPQLMGGYPSYFVCGPMVFSVASAEFATGLARAAMSLIMNGSPLMSRLFDEPAFEGEKLVVVCSPFFPHKLTKGYPNPFGQVIKSINGERVKNLGHLVELLRDCKAQFVCIQFDSRENETLVFPRAEMVAATDDILRDNGVRSQGSDDMMAIWSRKLAGGK